VKATHWARRDTGDHGTVFHHTFLLQTGAADGETLGVPIPRPPGVWEVTARPAPDGTYLDLVSRSAIVVRDGVIVDIVDV